MSETIGLQAGQLWTDLAAALALTLLLGFVNLSVRIIIGAYVYFVRPPVDPRAYGAWAVVTGASEGIGRAYVHLLAEKGKHF